MFTRLLANISNKKKVAKTRNVFFECFCFYSIFEMTNLKQNHWMITLKRTACMFRYGSHCIDWSWQTTQWLCRLLVKYIRANILVTVNHWLVTSAKNWKQNSKWKNWRKKIEKLKNVLKKKKLLAVAHLTVILWSFGFDCRSSRTYSTELRSLLDHGPPRDSVSHSWSTQKKL